MTVVEEAHRLMRNVEGGRASSHAVELFAALLAEIRAYGEGIVVAEQIPSKLLPDVIKNTACKFVHRLPAADDRAAVGATMNLTAEQSEYVVSLRPGTAAVFTDGMDRPVLAVMPDRSGHETGTLPEVRPPLVERAIGLCPAECQDRPCTLGDMGEAESVLRRHPRLELWIDVLAYNHIAGWPAMPRPQASWRRELVRSVPDHRLLACAVARAARRSADARQRWLVDTYQPDGLAGHLADVAGRCPGRTAVRLRGGQVRAVAGRSRTLGGRDPGAQCR